jgi:hypothetical protein
VIELKRASLEAQKKHSLALTTEQNLRAEVQQLEAQLIANRADEEQAGAALLDGGDEKAVRAASKRVRELEESVKIGGYKLAAARKKTADARTVYDDAQSAFAQFEADAEYKRLQSEQSEVIRAAIALNDAIRTMKGTAVNISQRYRAAGGRDANLGSFADSTKQLLINYLPESPLGEKGGSPDPAARVAYMVSQLEFVGKRGAA